ncbi:uncharacterized protein LOC101234360 isoform X1 [Hydra vulgaris]|uniref:Uncharacterized protein LOC101234360 isoform X1 n=1 Tax=Hydra vulgaris TaxID=6087 RepID=A0ABM4D3E4_HYDVU
MVLVALYTTYIVVLITLSTTLNLIICYVITRKIKAIEIPHLFILSISISDIVHTVVGLVSEVCVLHKVTSLKNSYISVGASFLTYSISVSNIMQIVMISAIRVVALKRPMFYFENCDKVKYKMASLCCCYFYGILWASFPLLGWSKYEEDLDKKRCSLDWNLTKSNTFSYLMFAFIFCYKLPTTLLIWALRVKHQTVDEHRRFRENCPNQQIEILEKAYLKVLLCSAIAYFVVWTPYSVVSLLSIFKVKIPSIIFTFCALFAKLSAVLNALVNCYINKSFQAHLHDLRIFQCFLKGKRIKHKNTSWAEETHA